LASREGAAVICTVVSSKTGGGRAGATAGRTGREGWATVIDEPEREDASVIKEDAPGRTEGIPRTGVSSIGVARPA